MAIRVNTLIREIGIGLTTLNNVLNALGYKEHDLIPNSKIPDDIADILRGIYSNNTDFLKLIDNFTKESERGNRNDSITTLI